MSSATVPITQAAQTLVVFALVLALFFVGMLALVADLGAVFVAYNRVDDGALLASQAGASAIDQGLFYSGTLRLDPPVAQQRCLDSLATAHLSGTCVANARSVTADVSQAVDLPIPVLGLRAPVRVTRTARPAFGGDAAVTTS
jgi:hypothetical protein